MVEPVMPFSIRLTLENMKRTVQAAFLDHMEGIKNEIAVVVTEVVDDFNFREAVRKVAFSTLERTVKEAVTRGITDAVYKTDIDHKVCGLVMDILKKG